MKQVERILLQDAALTASGEMRKLLGSSSKIIKGERKGVLTRVMYMSPRAEGGAQMCPWATQGCADTCLGHSSGRMVMDSSEHARAMKTLWFMEHRESFLKRLHWELAGHAFHASLRDMVAAARPNGSSDVLWEEFDVPQQHPDIQLYDYTKAPLAARKNAPDNYHLTFSYSEDPKSWQRAKEWLEAGCNVAVVLRTASEVELALQYGLWGYPVLNGDESDVRFFDPPSHIVALHAKGKAKRDKTGFVVDYAQAIAAAK